MKKQKLYPLLTLLLASLTTGCNTSNIEPISDLESPELTTIQDTTEIFSSVATDLSSDDFFSNRDYRTEIESDSPTTITLNGNSITSNGEGVIITDNIATITHEGTYILTGRLNEGQIIVDVIDELHKVQLVLDDVTLNCSYSAPINIVNADKVFITMLENSINYIYANIAENNSVDAGIFSKCDLTLNGHGKLNIETKNGAGIVGKDELTITSGTYHITADGHGLDSNDGIAIADGIFSITSGKDGLHAEHNTNSEKGYIYIVNGEFMINSTQDGMDASSFLEINHGTFQITTNGGWQMAPVKVAIDNHGARNNRFNLFNNTTASTEDTDTPSTKGLKSSGELRLYHGNFILDCYDDAIHSDTNVEIHNGTYQIGTADDGIHANWDLTITGGTIITENCFEGLEGQRIYISGGYIDMFCGDDGINAASANPNPETSEISLTISGGTIILDTNAEGDGVDSNGSILITGGDLLVSSTTDNRDTALDSQTTAIISGGSFIGTGSNSMTLQNFSTGSTQASMVITVPQIQTGHITLIDSNGNVLVDFTPVKQYQAITISTPDIIVGETYTLTAGEYVETITMDTLQYGAAKNNMMNNRR